MYMCVYIIVFRYISGISLGETGNRRLFRNPDADRTTSQM